MMPGTSFPRRDRERELIEVIGEAAAVALANEFAGTRLYVPAAVHEDHRIVCAIGAAAAEALCERFSPSTFRVPMLRELRAAHYRAEGLSDARIATRLGMTENGVGKLFKRLKDPAAGVTEAV